MHSVVRFTSFRYVLFHSFWFAVDWRVRSVGWVFGSLAVWLVDGKIVLLVSWLLGAWLVRWWVG